MKVLNVNLSLDPLKGGGTAERTFQISRSLVEKGKECTVLTTNLGLTPERIDAMDGIRVVALPRFNKRFSIPIFSYRRIKNIVKKIDIVHLMSHWTFINALIYCICKQLDKPYVVCPAGALPIYGRSKVIKMFYNCFIGRRIIRDADGHIAIATNEINQFKNYKVEPDKVSIIPNGINAEDFHNINIIDFRRKYNLNNNPFILFMGRLNVIKGPDLLLQAFANIKDKLHDYRLVFAGPDGGMLVELKKIVDRMGVGDRVHFIGFLEPQDRSQAYHAADLLVIPSRQEAMSIVVLEAGITGTPVLLTDQCGFDDVAIIGGGQIVSPSEEGIQKGLIEILGDPEQLQSMGANLKKYVEKSYTWDTVIEQYLRLYDRILSTRSSTKVAYC